MSPLQDPPQEEAGTGPSVDQDHEAEAAESSARVSSVPIRLGKNGKRLPDPSSDDDPDSDIEEEEEEEKEEDDKVQNCTETNQTASPKDDEEHTTAEPKSSAEQEEAAAQEFMTNDNFECPNDVLKRYWQISPILRKHKKKNFTQHRS